MNHVLWIGGPPGAGKTTVATFLARRYGLRLYRADTRTWEHRDRALAAGERSRPPVGGVAPREPVGPVHRRGAPRHVAARGARRQINDATVAQVRGYSARPWAVGNPDDVVRTFVCECGDASCTASFERTIGAFADG